MTSRLRRSARAGFTLIELLVVMGIIILLVAILLPVAGQVRRKASAVQTQAQLLRISQAIHNYFADFHAYPGPISNAQVSPGSLTGVTGITQNKVTSSENLVLALLGGLKMTNGSVSFDATYVGKGPQNLNPLSPKQYPPYMDMVSEEVSPGKLQIPNTGNADSDVPEFLDHISDPLPILYDRTNAGMTLVQGTANNAQYNTLHVHDYGSNLRFQDTTAYPDSWCNFDLSFMVGYCSGKPMFSDVEAFYPNWQTYFQNPSIPNVARGKDTFILISAGLDRTYGTKDDFIVTP